MLKGRKEQLLRTAYLSAARGDADVVNHAARRVVESQGKVQYESEPAGAQSELTRSCALSSARQRGFSSRARAVSSTSAYDRIGPQRRKASSSS
jgi:hypothetical protein